MRRFSERHGLHTISELNVTPLLDLAFVLLIIFMITTPLMENSSDLVLPSSEASSKAVDPGDVQTIAVNRDELISLNGTPTSLELLESQLTQIRDTQPNAAIVIRPHKDLPVQSLVKIMDVIQKARISKVGVVTHSQE
ncbi:MAG: Biopolymer transport protein ExbD [Verrucomicrobiota bacterium]|jgi:biopolymer transport protein ExbD